MGSEDQQADDGDDQAYFARRQARGDGLVDAFNLVRGVHAENQLSRMSLKVGSCRSVKQRL